MECNNCKRFKTKFICKNCNIKEIRNGRSNHTLNERELKIIISRMSSLWPIQLIEKQAERGRLKQSIDYCNELKFQINQAIAQANRKIEELKEYNNNKRERLDRVEENFQLSTLQGATIQTTKQAKLKEEDGKTQQSLLKTRRALLIKLGDLGMFTISFNNTSMSTKFITSISPQSGSNSNRLSGSNSTRRSLNEERGLNSKRAEFLGSIGFSLHLTSLISRYLGVSIPFNTQVIGPYSTLYLKHEYTDYQEPTKGPLYVMELNETWNELLKIMVSYNQLYLQRIALESDIKLNLLPDNILKRSDDTEILVNFLGACKKGGIRRSSTINSLIGTEVDPTFKPDFHDFLKAKGTFNNFGKKGIYAVYDNHFSPDIVGSSLEEDYVSDFSKSELPPAHKLINSNDGRAGIEKDELNDEDWENVEEIIPPTPSELSAVGM